ncbi:Fatty acid hydroxylase [Mycena kentingensis (nom. inval.)]|nr:Fatty acid hydroxylase [Mycena kentingensis (nom. inval.)]
MSQFTASLACAVHEWERSRPQRLATPPPSPFVLQLRSPVDRLPPELLTTVFALTIEPRHHDTLTTSPTTLSHVCRRWRAVALGLGSLWTSVAIAYPSDPSGAQFTRLLTYLSRTKGYKIDLMLDVRDPEWDFELPEEEHPFTARDMQALLVLLQSTRTAHRWRSVELLTDTWAPIDAFLRATRSSAGTFAQSMERLVLARCNAYFARNGAIFEPAALKHPLPLLGFGVTSSLPPADGHPLPVSRLRDVSLVGVHVDWSIAEFALGPALTHLALKFHASDVRPSPAKFSHILNACPCLETLAVVGSGPSFSPRFDPSSVPPIVLPTVTTFTLGFVDGQDATQLLALLRIPNLAKLELEDVAAGLNLMDIAEVGMDENLLPVTLPLRVMQEDDDLSARTVLAWLAESRTLPLGKLTSLSLSSFHIAAKNPALHAFLRECGSITEVSVAGTRRIAGILTGNDVLALRREPTCLLPRLTTVISRGRVLASV